MAACLVEQLVVMRADLLEPSVAGSKAAWSGEMWVDRMEPWLAAQRAGKLVWRWVGLMEPSMVDLKAGSKVSSKEWSWGRQRVFGKAAWKADLWDYL